MSDITEKYKSMGEVFRDLELFFKIDSGDDFSLADFSVIAEGRWKYLRDEWDFIKTNISDRIEALPDGKDKSEAKKQYGNFTLLIDNNKTSPQNPLSDKNNIRKFSNVLGNILLSDMPISPGEQIIINREIDRIKNLQKEDFRDMKKRIRITHDKTSDSFGLGDETYNKFLDRVGGKKILTFKLEDFSILSSLISTMDQITMMIPTESVRVEKPDPFEIVRNALNNPEIPIGSSVTGIMVPFPAGSTLERLAVQYLGSADRAFEIAIANGLKFPYVDEIGKKIPLLINGVGNIVILSLPEMERFFIGQTVYIQSDKEKSTKRKILEIREDKNNNQVILVLNGERDLSKYTTAQRAFVYVYEKYTINSDSFIMIPTADDIGFPINSEEPWFVKELPNDVRNMGVDLAVDQDFDLIFDSRNDLTLSYGLANASQALMLKMNIKSGELIRGGIFGMIEEIGRYSNNEINESIMTNMIQSALGGDDRYEGIDGIGYAIVDTGVFINATIKIAGTGGSIPLTFHLPKG